MKKAEILLKLPEEANECVIKSNKICSNKETIDSMKIFLEKIGKKIKENDKIKILDEMKNIMNCKSESCVITSKTFVDFVGNDKTIKNIRNFMPSGPSHTNTWLSNKNIDEVLEIYKNIYSDEHFYHIPYQLIDFETTQTELSKFDPIAEYDKGMRTFGVIINTDKSGGNGLHWFAIFGDFRNPSLFTIEYFNSVPMPEQEEIRKWVYKIKHKISKQSNIPVEFIRVNRLKHQTDSHSCGPYSLYYIWCRLNKVDYNYFNEYEVGSYLMKKFRKYLFRWNF